MTRCLKKPWGFGGKAPKGTSDASGGGHESRQDARSEDFEGQGRGKPARSEIVRPGRFWGLLALCRFGELQEPPDVRLSDEPELGPLEGRKRRLLVGGPSLGVGML